MVQRLLSQPVLETKDHRDLETIQLTEKYEENESKIVALYDKYIGYGIEE